MINVNIGQVKADVDAFLNGCINQFYKEVPGAKFQMESKSISKDYYKLHTIQTVLRIRHKRIIDALVVESLIKDYQMKEAKLWAEYTEDEMMHGQMFGKDLERLDGTTMDEIYGSEVFLATKLLNGYFYYTLEHEGPMASLASAYFLETTTLHTQPQWLDNLEGVFGTETLKGARTHVSYDEEVDHSGFVWQVLASTIKNEGDVNRLMEHMSNLYGLFSSYFLELHQKTSDMAADQKSIPNAAVNYALNAA
jgi:hypothetical protein